MSSIDEPLKFSDQTKLGVPWKHFAEAVLFTEEDAGQGSHPPHPVIAMLHVREYNGDDPFEVAIGGEEQIDALISVLRITKARMKVHAAEQQLSGLQHAAQHLEPTLL